MSTQVSLFTETLAEGQILARKLASDLNAAVPSAESMPDMLKTAGLARPTPEIAAAIYFHAISIANRGWTDSSR